MSDFTATVRCISCRQPRPGTQDRCPHCDAVPYRHKTADPQEFWDAIGEAQRADRFGAERKTGRPESGAN